MSNVEGGPFGKFSVSEVTTMTCTFEEDVKLYASAGCAGIGVWGFKMKEVGAEKARDLMQRHGLAAANCIPELNSIFPYVLSPEPVNPKDRVEAFLPNLEEMAKLEPESIVVITGPQGDRSSQEATEQCLEGYERIGRTASDLGVTIAFEPIHKSMRDEFTMVWDMPGALEMLRQLDQPNFKILFDTWHLWDTPEVYRHVVDNIDLIGGVHVADWQKTSRSWADRAFPGEGILPMKKLLSALREAGFDGLFDVEIFSDDGQFADDYPDSHWKLPAEEIVERSIAIFR